ncbi:chromosome partitioning protein [Asanoa sp. NPDC049573]|uniref:chromosome partitioning protein n=1 Tax=Asanoa sp. NPDC049573 TaxID=3155396 RepID=UPI00343E41E0
MVDDSDRVYRPGGNGAAQWRGAEQPWPPDDTEAGSDDQDPGAPEVPPPPPPIRVPAPPAPPPINRPGLPAPNAGRPAGNPAPPPPPVRQPGQPVQPPAPPPPPFSNHPGVGHPGGGQPGPAAGQYGVPAQQGGQVYGRPPAQPGPPPAPHQAGSQVPPHQAGSQVPPHQAGSPAAPPQAGSAAAPHQAGPPTAPHQAWPPATGNMPPPPAQPTSAQPITAQPTSAQPMPAQPTSAQPMPAQPTSAQPMPAQPTSAQPMPAQPTSAQPMPAQPTSAQPMPAPPTSAQPLPGQPAHPPAGPTPPPYRPPTTPPGQHGAAQQAAAMPMQRAADGPPTGTPWSQPPQRPTSPPAPPHPATAHPTSGQPGHPAQPPAAEPADPLPPEVAPGVVEVPQQGVYRMPTPSTPPATANPRAAERTPDAGVPTADDFARRRALRPPDPIATSGVRAVLNKTSMGVFKLPPGAHERSRRQEIETVRRNFGGLRQVTVVNPKGGAGKTVAILLLAMTFGQNRGGYVLAWDNNETQGTLGMRASQDFHNRTVRDLLRDLAQFRTAQGRVGDLSQYVRAQGEGMFDVLASDESATAGEMLTAAAFAHIRDVVSRFYKLIFVDTGNNVRAQNWQAAIDATDQLVVTMSARNDSAETAARMLDHLEQTGRHRLVRQAVTVVSMPPSRREIDLPPIESHFAARTRAVLLAPYERLIDTGEPIRYTGISKESRDAWLKIAAAVAEGL